MVEKVSYIIAGTPRTGSHWLCAWLRGCGAGNPREYLNRGSYPDWHPAPGSALKVFWNHLEQYPGSALDVLHNTWARMGGQSVRWVYLDRLDDVRQALSLARVRAGGKWTHPVEDGAVQPLAIPFDRARIDADRAQLARYKGYWWAFFEDNQITPLRIFYEDMQAGMEAVVRRVLAHVGVGVFQPVAVPFQKQGGADIELLVRRYHAGNS